MPPLGRGIMRSSTADDEREEIGCFHFVNEGKKAGIGDRGGRAAAPSSGREVIRARSHGRIAQVR